MTTSEVITWLQSCDDAATVERVRNEADRRLHDLRHADAYGAGAGTRQAGARPYVDDGARPGD